MTKNRLILGAAAGDIIGSAYEFNNVKTTEFDLFTKDSYFTDDSVLTIATMEALLKKSDYTETYQKYGRMYSYRGYGGRFEDWLYEEKPEPYNSWGNGSAMRSSPIGWYCGTIEAVMEEAKKEIKEFITKTFEYNLDRTLDEIRPGYEFEVSCQGSAPEAIIAFLESDDFESAVRLAVSIGGDSDTIACIAGAIAEAFYGEIPAKIADTVFVILGPDLLRGVIMPFSRKYGNN
jgi:ADP-ribosylglycohydrolase